MKRQIYRVDKDLSLCSYNSESTNKLQTIDRLKQETRGGLLVIGNDNKLNCYLFNKDWVDEIIVCTFPVVLRKGRRPFPTFIRESLCNVRGC